MNQFVDGMLMAAIPIGLSGFGWLVIKVIQHDAWLSTMKAAVERIENKLDRLLEQ